MAPMLIQEVEEPQTVSNTTYNIELSSTEATLRQLLLDVAQYIDSSSSTDVSLDGQTSLPSELAQQKLCLRFTGGWVRDKLLGVPSVDIDVAINKMTGYQFGLKMKEYLEIPGNLPKYGLESIAENEKQNAKAGATDKSKTVGGLHKIEANPEKSKHLETTTMRILGLDIDLVNLRKETYSEDSRNPQMEFGTAEEDAVRRDATVNAMFYNINTQQVEDFTGAGHTDMQKKILRTPLEPFQTFKDDPLRVLRLIRFASRLGYTIEAEAMDAMRNSEIKEALRRKISRERVGTELEKALRGPDPHEALRLVLDLKLYETIFSDPTVDQADHYTPDLEHWKAVIDTLQENFGRASLLFDLLVRDKEEEYTAWQLAAMVPYHDAPQPPPPEANRKAPPPTAVTVAREGIKATNKICEVLTAALRHQAEIADFVDRLHRKQRRPQQTLDGPDPTARDVLGMALRRWGASWRSQVMYAMQVEVAGGEDDPAAIEKRYEVFVTHIQDLGLLEAHTLKPLLDGKALAKALSTPPGPWMKDALDVVMAWQLRHPDVTDPAAAIEQVRAQRTTGELTSDLACHFLTLTIRPLFRQARSEKLTAAGRKLHADPLPTRVTLQGADETTIRPWKTATHAVALDLLRWCVIVALDQRGVKEFWPLLVPPILTLVDDWEVRYKILGVEFLASLLEKTPAALLKQTGLGNVFEEALLPCLTYLPTLTPPSDSIALLDQTYPALLLLTNIRFPDAQQHSVTAQGSAITNTQIEKIKSLDNIIRKGIIYAYTHAGEYPDIVATLLRHLGHLLDALGVDAIKHIKYLLPILTQSLSHPLASAAGADMSLSAAGALQCLMRNCWPRILHHRVQILKGLALCWLTSVATMNEKAQVKQLADVLKENVELLGVIVGKECDFASECATLVAADERLGGLFTSVLR